MVKVGVVGYGTIGKRVADAILLQDDMELVGVTANTYNYRIKTAHKKGIKIFTIDSLLPICWHSIDIAGNFDDLVKRSDIIVDCTPKGTGRNNKKRYKYYGTKAIFQGGEDPDIGKSFVSQCNYDEVVGSDFIRVVSCNTTGLCRTLYPIDQNYGIDKVHATMIRRAADPWDIYHGPINALVPHLIVPSHHGPDVRTIIPDLEIFTTSISAPTTLMHMHSITVDLKVEPTVEETIRLFEDTTRVRVVHNSDGIRSTAEIMEYANDLDRSRGDMPEVCVWSDTIGVWNKKLLYIQAVHQESDVIPENIDAIRASMGICNKNESIRLTNSSLDI
jgi:glyceraldehyde-3-phosphate dehydrogenase (NAD(P))